MKHIGLTVTPALLRGLKNTGYDQTMIRFLSVGRMKPKPKNEPTGTLLIDGNPRLEHGFIMTKQSSQLSNGKSK